nr:ABC transporter permease [uncultured Lichenicoccus sp.]
MRVTASPTRGASEPFLDLLPETPARRVAHALDDVRRSLLLWRLCWRLGWLDLKLRYRGSILGPFWLTASTAVMVGSMGLIYAYLFKMNVHDYLPFLTLSLVLWGFIGGLVGDSTVCFTQAEGMIRAMRMPFTVHAIRVVIRNLLVLAHNVVVILAVFGLFHVWPGPGRVPGHPGPAALAGGRHRGLHPARSAWGKVPRHQPGDRKRDADHLLHHADHLEARADHA